MYGALKVWVSITHLRHVMNCKLQGDDVKMYVCEASVCGDGVDED